VRSNQFPQVSFNSEFCGGKTEQNIKSSIFSLAGNVVSRRSALSGPREGSKGELRFRRVRILTIAVGTLQVALDKGQEDDWFGSHFITTLLIIAAVGLISLVIWEWFHKEPIVDVHLFKIFTFMSSSRIFFIVGVVLL